MTKKSELISIYLIMLTEILGWSLILPFLPFFALDLGATPFQVGLILAVFSVFQFVSAPIIGKLSDRYGRKTLLIISQFSTFIGFIILGFANSIWMIVLSRVVDGLLGSNMTLAKAYLGDISSGKNRQKNYGYMSAVFGIGFFIGPALGGFLATINYSLPSFLAAGFSLLTIILTITILREPKIKREKVKLKINDFFPLKDFLQALKHPVLKNFLFEFFFFVTAFSTLTGSLALISEAQFNLGPGDVGFMLMLVGLVRILFQLLVYSKLVDKFEERTLAITGITITMISMLFIAITTTQISIYLALMLFSVGAGLTQPTFISIVSSKAGDSERGKFMGVMDAMRSVSQIIGPLLGGFVIQYFYPGILGFIGSGLMLIALIIELKFNPQKTKKTT
ncbi:MAG: MFS transporter [Nanoarchaeota archaeon]|nr:MFS transporter [Nanoarchaeota archaeon]